jgi:hypothetical protein
MFIIMLVVLGIMDTIYKASNKGELNKLIPLLTAIEIQETNSSANRGISRRRPILEVLDALNSLCDDPKIRLICNQMITNDGLNPLQPDFSADDRELLDGRSDEMKKVEAILKKAYANNSYMIDPGDYLIAIKQLEGIQ